MTTFLSKKGTLGAALSLSVATIGAGTIALPSTFEDCGIIPVVAFMILVGVFTVISIDYLILCVETVQLRSYEDISRELLGLFFEQLARWMLIVFNIGVAAGYIVVIGDIFELLLPIIRVYLPFFDDPMRITLAIWACVMLPLACVPQVSSLRFVSIVAIASTFFISGVITYRYFAPQHPSATERRHGAKYISLSRRMVLTLPILMFSFDCQTLVFQLYAGIGEKTQKGMRKVSILSILVTGLVYFTLGLFGYLSNTPHVHGNILTNYDPVKDRLFAVGDAMYSFTVITAYVLVLFPCRDAAFILLYGYSTATHESCHDAISTKDNLIATCLLSVISLLLALKAPGILFIIALLGGLCSSSFCFTLPAAFRLRLHALGIAPASSWELFVALAMLSLGCIGGVMGTVVLCTGMS
ncbi:putative amino acid permease-like protein [Trypanosoma conorhini]|uniref:Putative amino acid permease-like protein n=1 Tax=Trypanosoma conorhini TaxID=83891 RepID=A0A422NV15_9TRYP|nr:putative amino acid permease-like protein [Trypanosoma conorhini]RNF09290.1 putative amino acid permease-like protein [Trypanosoma conorhini]